MDNNIKHMSDDELIQELRKRGYVVYKPKPRIMTYNVWATKHLPVRILERMSQAMEGSRL